MHWGLCQVGLAVGGLSPEKSIEIGKKARTVHLVNCLDRVYVPCCHAVQWKTRLKKERRFWTRCTGWAKARSIKRRLKRKFHRYANSECISCFTTSLIETTKCNVLPDSTCVIKITAYCDLVYCDSHVLVHSLTYLFTGGV